MYVNRLLSAAEVIAQLPAWFEDYDQVHPHKGLEMRSPREIIGVVLVPFPIGSNELWNLATSSPIVVSVILDSRIILCGW